MNCKEFSVHQINYDDAIPFILNIHYAHRIPCIQYAYGLFEDDELIGIVTYGQPPSPNVCIGVGGVENKHRVLELNRLVFLPNRGKKNYASYLISKSLKLLPPKMYVVSYADTKYGHVGYVYQATNFFYTGCTKARTDKIGVNGGHSRHYKSQETKRQDRSAKHRYVTITGSKRDKRDLKRQMKWKILNEYPKGDTQRYDDKGRIEVQGTLF